MDQANNDHKKKILIVDDEPNIIIPIEFLMINEGYQVEKAFNGQEAIVKLESYQPDVIILDVMMPGMDGFEVAKKIRLNDKFSNVHIIFLTAKGTEQDRLTGYDSGGEVYLTKPFDNEQLVNTVNELIKF
jgi:DNA-binding response OmpR family regulator